MSDEKKVIEAEVVPEAALSVRDNATLVALERATIDQQVATAKAYPRSVEQFKQDVMSMATLDQETAESMSYQLPRDGKLIEGPSIRLAEIAGSCWGNVRYASEVIEVGDEYLVAQGRCHDLQRNVDIALRVRRRIVNKYGKRFGTDMISITGAAACSIALRNAILKVVPMAYVKPVLEAAKRVAAGDEKTLAARRDAALLWFKDKGVKAEWVFGLLGVKGKEDIALSHIAQLGGIRNAIKEGEATVQEFFEPFMPGGSGHSTVGGVVSVDSLKATGVKVETASAANVPQTTASAATPPTTDTAKASPSPAPPTDGAAKKADSLFE